MLSEDLARALISSVGQVLYLLLAFALFSVVPIILLVLLALCLVSKRTRGRHGLALGFAVALWASCCWLIVPYCGGYPNLPGLLVVMLLGSPVDTWWKETIVHVVNFAVWPFVGWLVMHVKARAKGNPVA